MSSVSLGHDLSEQGARLLVVSVWVLVSIAASVSRDRKSGQLLGGIFSGTVEGVGLIVRTAALVAVDGGRTVSLIVGDAGTVGAVNGDLIVVGS